MIGEGTVAADDPLGTHGKVAADQLSDDLLIG
jgi:hypothetical protein